MNIIRKMKTQTTHMILLDLEAQQAAGLESPHTADLTELLSEI